MRRQILGTDSKSNINLVKSVASPTQRLTEKAVSDIPSINPTGNKTSSVASSAKTDDSEKKLGYKVTNSQSSRPSSQGSLSSRGSLSSQGSLSPRLEIKPRSYPVATTVYNSIKKNDSQTSTESLKQEDLKKIEEKQLDMNNLPKFYLFVVLNDKILCVFESKTEFILGTTNKYNNTNLLPNNYITSTISDFNSVTQINKDENITADTIPGTTQKYIPLGSYSPTINGSIIEFYVYDAYSTLTKTYFTYGKIFIYGEGIASTCEIVESKIQQKTDVLPHPQLNQTNLFDPLNKPLNKQFDALILEIKSKIFGSDTDESLLKEKVYIHYLNAISPDDLKQVFTDKEKIKAVVKILYVNVSCPPDGSVDKYNLLHKYINYYYNYKQKSLDKIKEYIDEQTEFSQFTMHIFDFFEFLMFLKNKESENKELVQCCIKIYNYYWVNYTNGFATLALNEALITQIQQKLQEKQKKIYTYLQIINYDATKYNTRFEVKLNTQGGGNYGQGKVPITNSTSMILEFKTMTGLNPETQESDTYKFGPFDKIYKPEIIGINYNQIVAEPKFKQMIAKITPDSPMMFSFHGPSGSKPTKILKQVLIGLCNKLATEQQYEKLEIGFKEIFMKYDDSTKYDSDIKNFNLSFLQQFKFETPVTHIPYHNIKLRENKVFNTDTDTLDTLLNYFLDEDRLVKGFPSNHNSSRSHVLCFLKMSKNDGSKCNIIFLDLAENEKKYDCANDLQKFINIRKNDSKTSFYENEFDVTGNIFDHYKGGTIKEDMKKKVNGKESELYKTLIGKACIHRTIEGDFINDSLKEFRTDLEYVVDVKNRNNAYYIPDIYHNIIDKNGLKTCLQDFCFGKTNCFSLKGVQTIDTPQSIILKSVYDYLKLDSTENFYDKLEVCIVGALNITSKDKPPPTNYVDINTVKSIIQNKDEFTFNNNPGVFATFKTQLYTTQNHAKRINSINSHFPENYVSDLLSICYDIINKKDKTSLTLAEIKTFQAVFDAIDDENAKTAIGTLEFINKISKFNTVNSICFEKNDNATYESLYPKK